MKKFSIIILLLSLLGIGCGIQALNSYTAQGQGKIIKVESTSGGTVILVEFSPGEKGVVNYFEFYGSDTCRVGQIVHLSSLNQ